MSFGSWEPYEMLAATHLLDEDDPTRLTLKELKDGWGEASDGRGPCSLFMESYCLKPWNQEDLEEALAISKAMKEADQENDSNYGDNEKITDSLVQDGAEVKMAAPLPTIGRWIKWTMNAQEFKCEILDYGTVEDYESDFLPNIYLPTQEKYVNVLHVRYIDGIDECLHLEEEPSAFYDWTYCDAPSQEKLEQGKYEQLNKEIGNRSCANCGCSNKKLQICTGCHKQYYCDANCQRTDWAGHKDTCKKKKIILKPNPRYPMAQISKKVKARQAKIQKKHNQLLQDALNGNFTVQRNASPVRNPKSGSDLACGERYELVINNKAFEFKWNGLESSRHSIPENQPTACSLFWYMEMTFSGDDYVQGGLHYLAGSCDETFWYMLINFNTFGTVAPTGPCFCNPNNVKGQMPLERRKLRKRWDRIFKRAKKDMKDVQCMFSDTEEGCHNYIECPYKHDVEIEEEREKEQEQQNNKME